LGLTIQQMRLDQGWRGENWCVLNEILCKIPQFRCREFLHLLFWWTFASGAQFQFLSILKMFNTFRVLYHNEILSKSTVFTITM
jgi:hypothetical protein